MWSLSDDLSLTDVDELHYVPVSVYRSSSTAADPAHSLLQHLLSWTDSGSMVPAS